VRAQKFTFPSLLEKILKYSISPGGHWRFFTFRFFPLCAHRLFFMSFSSYFRDFLNWKWLPNNQFLLKDYRKFFSF